MAAMTEIRAFRRRLLLLATVPVLVAHLPALGLLLVAAERLPDPLASHFGPGGGAAGYTGRSAMVLVVLGTAVVVAAVLGALAARPGWVDDPRWLIASGWGTAVFVGVTALATVVANLDLADAAAALIPWWTIPVAIAASVGACRLGWLAAPSPAPSWDGDRSSPPAEAPAP